MGDNEIKSICKGLEKNSSITLINLGIINIYWNIIYSFYIGENESGENGMENIAHMLEHNQTIQVLELYLMGLSDKCLQIFSQGMKKNISLAKLDLCKLLFTSMCLLDGNYEITDKGIQYLYEAVKIRKNHILDINICIHN